jgi:hypothetical protein
MDNRTASLKELRTIPGIGKSLALDLYNLGYHSLDNLRGEDAELMYIRLNDLGGSVQDICVLYAFRCAIYYAETFGDLQDPEKLKWWNWMDEKRVDSITKDKEIRLKKSIFL